jgi:hypothetical protein
MSLGVLGDGMRQLDTCDFCGEQPEGVYEVVPESIADGPQRLALCVSCRDTLQSVVDPLLDGAAGGSADEPSHSDAGSEAAPRTESTAEPAGTETETAGGAQTGPERSSSQPDASLSNETESAESTATDETAETPAEKPDGYAQVLRLLQNRDEAMPREDLRALATNAYDLDGRTFENAVDAAVENGDVEEAADGLRTL